MDRISKPVLVDSMTSLRRINNISFQEARKEKENISAIKIDSSKPRPDLSSSSKNLASMTKGLSFLGGGNRDGYLNRLETQNSSREKKVMSFYEQDSARSKPGEYSSVTQGQKTSSFSNYFSHNSNFR